MSAPGVNPLGDLILSIRKKIPDPVPGNDPGLDGSAFSLNELLVWINDAQALITLKVPVIQDWFGVPSIIGQDTYPLPNYIGSVEQTWYDLIELGAAAEGDSIFPSHVTGRSWWFAPHSIHAIPRLYVFPAPARAGGSSTLNGAVAAGATSVTYTVPPTVAINNSYGYARIGTASLYEIIKYTSNNTSTGVLTNVLKGQGGTKDLAWNSGSPIAECNIFFACYRQAVPITKISDVLEIPRSLWPLIDLYILAQVKYAEQDVDNAMKMEGFFHKIVDDLGNRAQLKGLRQTLQVKTTARTPELFRGRIFIP